MDYYDDEDSSPFGNMMPRADTFILEKNKYGEFSVSLPQPINYSRMPPIASKLLPPLLLLAPPPKIHELLEPIQAAPPPAPTYQSRPIKTARTTGREILAAAANYQPAANHYLTAENKIYPSKNQTINKTIENNITTNINNVNNSVPRTKNLSKNKKIGGCVVVIIVVLIIGVIVALLLSKSSNSSSSSNQLSKYIITLI